MQVAGCSDYTKPIKSRLAEIRTARLWSCGFGRGGAGIEQLRLGLVKSISNKMDLSKSRY
jgi:hypothetical protein